MTQQLSSASGLMPIAAAGPGQLTLTQLLSPAGPKPTPGAGPGAATYRPPPTRVAEAKQDEAKLNAVLKVLVIDDGKVTQRWQSKARWVGRLPVRWVATRAGGRWQWDHPDARSLKVQTDARGGGGSSVEAWAKPTADTIVVHVQAIEDVTVDADAEPDAMAPGHAKQKEDAGDGSSMRIQPGGEGPRTGDDAQAGAVPRKGGDRRIGDTRAEDRRDPEDTQRGDDRSLEQDEALGPSEADEQLADDFERELGLEIDGEDATGQPRGEQRGGKGEPGGSSTGRTGDDTRKDGTGPGGEQAEPDGKEKGSEDGGRGGSEDGSRDGTRGGDADGMYGGKGESGDGGVPSAVALFGGILSVPAALRGFVELALIVSSADVTGAGSQLFKKGLGKIASAAAARRMIAHEARVVAVKETKLAIKRIATDAKTAKAWANATAAEKQQVTRTIYWELQRKYFQGYLSAARRAKSEAKAALSKASTASSAQQRLKTAELAEEAAAAPPVAGRLPQNHEFAGKQFPADRLPHAYRQKGLRFSEAGYPDFSPYAQTLPNGQKSVQITYTGSRSGDFAAANAKAGYKEMPRGFTWHHQEDGKTMLLVPDDLHYLVKHTGGVATYKHTSGVASYGK